MSALAVSGLQVVLGGRPVIDGLDLAVPVGSITAVLGPSGCGKTTLLRAIAGFAPISAGVVEVGERVVADARRSVPPEGRGIGLVPQEGALFPHLDVAGNIAFGLPRRARRRSERVAELLDLIGLEGFGRRRPGELSGGQQQRVALARALAPQPVIVLLDEPFSALDAGLRAELRAEIGAALRAAGATALMVTHDQDEALSMADSIAVLDAGRILMHAPPQVVYSAPTDLRVARFVGDGRGVPAVAWGGTARTALGELAIEPTVGAGVPGTVWLRPENICFTTDGIPGRVQATHYCGHETINCVRVSDGVEVLVRAVVAPESADVRLSVAGRVRFFANGPN